jgi:hypothetical protein
MLDTSAYPALGVVRSLVAAVSMSTMLKATKGLDVLTNSAFAWTHPP